MTLTTAAVCVLLVILGGSGAKDLASIRYRFTPCGAVGRRGPEISQCMIWYSQQNSPIVTNGSLISFQSKGSTIFQGSQGFRIPKSGLYNITVAGAAGGRGICSIQQGRGLLWRGTVQLKDSQDLLVSVGQKGLEPCELLDIPVCADPPKTLDESNQCFQDWQEWLAIQKLSQNAASTTRQFGGGGAGGGASMLRIRSRETGQFAMLPVVIAGGGGGSAAILEPSILSTLNITPEEVPSNSSDLYTYFINAKMTDRDLALVDVHNFSGIRGYIASSVNIFNQRPGAGGGYFPAVSLQQDGSPLNTSEDFALGGFDCLHLSTDLSQRALLETVHGGFGGGGGQCESGGSGGGYTGGSVFSNRFFGIPGNGGFYNYFSAPPNNAIQLSVELNPELNGFVEIVLADCGCGYKCIVDEKQNAFQCGCPDNTTLAPNKLDCYKGFIIDTTDYEQLDYAIEGLLITYIPFNESLDVFGVSSSVTLHDPSLDSSFSISSEPKCTLMFIDETGNVYLTTNTIRARSGVVDQLAPVNRKLDFEGFLDTPYSVVGAVLVSNSNCSIANNILDLTISESSKAVEPVANITLNLKNVAEIARNVQGLVFISNLDDEHPKLSSSATSASIQPSTNNGNILLIGSVSTMGALLVVVMITILGSLCCLCCCCKKRTKYSPKPVHTTIIHDNSMVQNLLYNHHTPSVASLTRSEESSLKSVRRQELTASICSFTPTFDVSVPDHSFTSYNMQRNSAQDNAWEYSRSALIYMKELGEGQFGKVLLMKAHSIGGFNGTVPVAVKTLSSTDPVVVEKFSEEANLMKKFTHPNIVSILGVSFEDVDKDNAPLMILEYMPYGDLNSFLRKYRPDAVNKHCGIEVCHIYCFARDVAEGLAFLSSRHYVHGDIASRNCLVGPALNIKIADFGLTNELESDADSYKLEGSAVLPLRWLSPESIVFGRFSYASDVWSYGVLLWEIVTYGELPLRSVSSEEIVNMAENRTLQHTRPPNCPDDIHEIITSCHQHLPGNRMNINDIKRKLSKGQ